MAFKMRPLYETKEDLSREREVGEAIAEKWKVGIEKLPIKYIVDYGLTRNEKVVAWAEIRCRSKVWECPFISAQKYWSGIELSKKSGLPFFLIFSFPKLVCYRKIEEGEFPDIVFGGRGQIRDWQDREPMVVMDIQGFTKIDVVVNLTTSWGERLHQV
jgi:hypothetical protein